MRLSKGVEWAAHCCVSLAESTDPQPATRLAELHGVPAPYLAKQLQALAQAGVLSSTAGQIGGYRLMRPATEITLLDIVDCIDGTKPIFRCTEIRQCGPLKLRPDRCTTPCAIARAMTDAETAWRNALAQVSIAELSDRIDTDSDHHARTNVRTWLARAR